MQRGVKPGLAFVRTIQIHTSAREILVLFIIKPRTAQFI